VEAVFSCHRSVQIETGFSPEDGSSASEAFEAYPQGLGVLADPSVGEARAGTADMAPRTHP